ncbi:hypothetical protein D9M69_661650 [compost metagenome]
MDVDHPGHHHLPMQVDDLGVRTHGSARVLLIAHCDQSSIHHCQGLGPWLIGIHRVDESVYENEFASLIRHIGHLFPEVGSFLVGKPALKTRDIPISQHIEL